MSTDDRAEVAGAGLVAVVAVLAPILSGTLAAISLLVGYILQMLDPEPAFADTLLIIGWLSGALTAGAILVAAVGLLFSALREGTQAVEEEAETALLAVPAHTRRRASWVG
ncbi:hypothetical protein ACFVZ2_18380, partial [Streptomyces lasiicapitis]